MPRKRKSPRRSAFGPSQQDIADALGIAQTTVALAMNPKYQHRFAATTVEMVLQKAEEMGYRPKRFAQIMRGSRSGTIGILMQISIHQINRAKIDAIVRHVLASGFTPIISDLQWFRGDLRKAVHYLLDHMVEGIIFVDLIFDTPPITIPEDVPNVIILGGWGANGGGQIFDVDIASGFYELTQHHLSTGSRRLALLLNQRHTVQNPARPLELSLGARMKGFSKAILEAGGHLYGDVAGMDVLNLLGLPPPPRRLQRGAITGHILAPEWQWNDPLEVGKKYGAQLLEGKQRFDSILGSNDAIALGVMRAAYEKGVKIPAQLRLSGYDNDVGSSYLTPSLTTMEIPLEKLASDAVKALISRIEEKGGAGRAGTKIYQPRLIVGESTAGFGA